MRGFFVEKIIERRNMTRSESGRNIPANIANILETQPTAVTGTSEFTVAMLITGGKNGEPTTVYARRLGQKEPAPILAVTGPTTIWGAKVVFSTTHGFEIPFTDEERLYWRKRRGDLPNADVKASELDEYLD
jgi:hypothetical protein